MSPRCQEFHDVHRAIALQRDRLFSPPARHTSISVSSRDPEWSSALELSCVEADGKFAMNIQSGIRNETIERNFAAPSRSLSLSKYLTINPEIDPPALAAELERASDDIEKLLVNITSTAALIRAVEAQGGSTLVFGSWTHKNYFPSGRTADEIRAALR